MSAILLTILISFSFNRIDFIYFWDLYYYYKNDVDEDSSVFDNSDFGIILEYVKNLLRYVKYQEEVIVA
jgi:hypothetical protein